MKEIDKLSVSPPNMQFIDGLQLYIYFLFDEVNDNGISHINKIQTTFAQLVRPLLALSKESIFALESELKQC